MATPRTYVANVYGDALSIGIPEPQARLAAAQSALETGYGKSAPGNAYFGIKAGKSWQGQTQSLSTKEEVGGKLVSVNDKFRAYDDPADSLRDWWNTLQRSWPDAANAATFDDAIAGLNNGVHGKYATQSSYGRNLKAINRNSGPVIPPMNIPEVGTALAYAGSSGGKAAVRDLQQQLKAAGFNPGTIDGIKGPKTTAAIKAFQQANGLRADGIVGPQTSTILAASSSAPTPLPSRPAALAEKYLTGDGGLGYGVPPMPSAPPLPRGDPRSLPPLPQADPRNGMPSMAATGNTMPPIYSAAATGLTVPSLPPSGAATGMTMPSGQGSAYNPVTDAQRTAMAALPPSAAPQINNAQAAADFYSGFGLESGPTAAQHPPTVGDRATELAAATAPRGTPAQITDQASAGDFYSGFGLAQPQTAMDALNRAIGVPSAQASSAIPYAPVPRADAPPPMPMERLRVTPGDITDAVKNLTAGSNVNLNNLPPDQQQALVSALPVLMSMPQGQDGDIQRLKYLQANNLLDPLMKVVPTRQTSALERGLGGMRYGIPIPNMVPTDPGQWGLGSIDALTTKIASATNPDAFRRPLNAMSGVQSAPPLPQANRGADLASLAIPSSVPVPKYVTISKQVPIPSSQPIETGSGVHWDDAAGNYVLDAPQAAPKQQFKTVTQQVPNPKYVAPTVPVPGAPPPMPMNIDPGYLAYLRDQAKNPLQRWFEGTPAGHIAGLFAPDTSHAFGAPARGGLLGLLSGGFGGNGGGLLGALSTPEQVKAQAAGMTAQQRAYQNPLMLAAVDSGRTNYTTPGGLMMPTKTIGGQLRQNTYGDYGGGSPYGSNGSLVG